MLLIKQLYNLFDIFKKNKENEKAKKDPSNFCVIELALNTNFDVDIFIEFDNLEITSEQEYNLYTSKIAEFLNTVNSQYVTYTLAKLIMEDIGGIEQYKQFTNDVIRKWTILEKEKDKEKEQIAINDPIIKPTEVFSKYYNTNK